MTRFVLSFCACSLLAVSCCLAAEAAPPASPWAPVIEEVAKSVGALVGVLVLALGGLLLNVLRQKFGIDLSAATNARLQVLAQQAATYAEEKAGAAVKAGAQKLQPDAKLAEAVAWLRRQNPALTEEQARDAILAALPFVGAGSLAQDEPPPQG